MKILSNKEYNELISQKKFNEREIEKLDEIKKLKKQLRGNETGIFFGTGYIAFNTEFWNNYTKNVIKEKEELVNQVRTLEIDLEWYKEKYKELKFKEKEGNNNNNNE